MKHLYPLNIRSYALSLLLLLVPLQLSTAGGVVAHETPRKGKDVAIFFAVNKYEHYTDLKEPIKDAEAIAEVLRSRYDFETEIYQNPSYQEISAVLKRYRQKYIKGDLDATGQLFVYFSGHGIEDYFMAANTEKGNEEFYSISYYSLRKRLDAFNCKHILVAIDACHSVTFDPHREGRGNPKFEHLHAEIGTRERLLKEHQKHKTRFFLSSDAKNDQTPDNSEFAFTILKALKEGTRRDGLLTFSDIRAGLKQTNPPGHGDKFGHSDVGASFLFVGSENQKPYDPRQDIQNEKDLAAWRAAQSPNSIAAYSSYLQNFPSGIYARQASAKINRLRDDNDWEIAQAREDADYYLSRHTRGAHVVDAKAMKKTKVVKPKPPVNRLDPILTQLEANMVSISGGSFTMGKGGVSTDEKPAHQVQLSSYQMGKYEVTQAEWRAVMGDNPSHFKCDQCPVEQVSYDDVQEFLKKLNKLTGKKYRLPTEAEWEYAARGGQSYKYAGSNDIDKAGWYWENSGDKGLTGDWSFDRITNNNCRTHAVGQKAKNGYDLYDMSGNVWEWCSDWYDGNYYEACQKQGSTRNPEGPLNGSDRVGRGGGWSSNAFRCQLAHRNRINPGRRDYGLGFRLAHSSE